VSEVLSYFKHVAKYSVVVQKVLADLVQNMIGCLTLFGGGHASGQAV
jgi:hypothetical protein